MVRQFSGEYACNSPFLKPLLEQAINAVAEIRAAGVDVQVQWIPRERNGEADKLSKEAVREVMLGDPGVFDKITMRYGKYSGKKLSQVPASYLEWLKNRGS